MLICVSRLFDYQRIVANIYFGNNIDFRFSPCYNKIVAVLHNEKETLKWRD